MSPIPVEPGSELNIEGRFTMTDTGTATIGVGVHYRMSWWLRLWWRLKGLVGQ